MKAGQQFKTLFNQYLRLEFMQLERLISPLLFAVTFLLVFMFAMGKVEPEQVPTLFIAEAFLAGFFALQLSFARSLEPDSQDAVFSLLRSYPIAPGAWFMAKYLTVLTTGILILMPTVVFSAFFHAESRLALLDGSIFLIGLLALLGLCSVGVLLSILTLGAGARQILFPLIYFPLTTPVLLAAVESSRAVLIDGVAMTGLISSWLGLLLVFDLIYTVLGLLLFGELVKAE